MEMAKFDCGQCRYWVMRKSLGKHKNGDCRRYAPTPGTRPTYLWPSTKAEDWCGDYKAKPKVKGTLIENGG